VLLFSCGLQFTGGAITAGPLRAPRTLYFSSTDERLTDRNASVLYPPIFPCIGADTIPVDSFNTLYHTLLPAPVLLDRQQHCIWFQNGSNWSAC